MTARRMSRPPKPAPISAWPLAPAIAETARRVRVLLAGAMLFATLVLALVVSTQPAAAAALVPTLYVDEGDANCSDSGSGTATQPFCTIRPAASRVVAGQTVLVSAGTYNEQVTVSCSGTASAP